MDDLSSVQKKKLKRARRKVFRKIVSLSLRGQLGRLFRYVKERRLFRQLGGKVTHTFIVTEDYDRSAGVAKGHYFHQDLLVARMISERGPRRHIDVGSRFDGFVAHVASFREIEVLDIRPMPQSQHENIKFLQADLMAGELPKSLRADSVSCLHVIEHLGLGRYGDHIDPDGHKKGFRNLLRILEPGGHLYISFPIASQNEIHFNAHRVFCPSDIFKWFGSEDKCEVIRFDYVDDFGALNLEQDPFVSRERIVYGCGIYTIKKLIG